MLEYVGILILGILALIVSLSMLCSNVVFGPKHPNSVKSEPFECGVKPIALPTGRLSVRFYVVAMLFVVFDVELAFLFPWAVLVRELGWFGIVEMGFFLAIVIAGFVYAWRKGAIEFK